MRNIQDDTKIAGSYTVSYWKELRQEILEKNENESLDLWEEAFEIFRTRVKTRFLDPIDAIIGMKKYEGEGFSVVALQCILVEFFESFYQGKVYVAPKSDEEISNQARELEVDNNVLKRHLQPNEYRASSRLFKDFLMRHKPFSESFTSRYLADRFYSNIRCGLLHEAATKGSSKIKDRRENLLIEEIPSSGKNIILYRTNFQEALKNYIEDYHKELLTSRNLQISFIRKMDDICQFKKLYYFAYGSNLKKARLQERIGVTFESYPECHKGFIKGFSLVFNKKSKDGSSKANLVKGSSDGKTWGVCYELTENEYEKIKKCEIGYEEKEVAVYSEDNKLLVIASTFISDQIWEQPPTQEYFKLVYEGAEEHKLPEEYLSYLLSQRPDS